MEPTQQQKIDMYYNGWYLMPVPLVQGQWTINDYINYIDMHGKWLTYKLRRAGR